MTGRVCNWSSKGAARGFQYSGAWLGAQGIAVSLLAMEMFETAEMQAQMKAVDRAWAEKHVSASSRKEKLRNVL